ncbi:MAG: hypothetical protein HON76_19215 [Candidatus Scalindua sp.]|nr:hypothetical protein [Candidatus Scalindua sp.]
MSVIWSASSAMMRFEAVTPAHQTGGQAVTMLQKMAGRFSCFLFFASAVNSVFVTSTINYVR